jgi:hypothetical protein
VRDDILIDNKTFLLTDFVNLKIKLTQFFECAHRGRIYVCVFIRVNAHTCISIYIYTVFLKKENADPFSTSNFFLFLLIF